VHLAASVDLSVDAVDGGQYPRHWYPPNRELMMRAHCHDLSILPIVLNIFSQIKGVV